MKIGFSDIPENLWTFLTGKVYRQCACGDQICAEHMLYRLKGSKLRALHGDRERARTRDCLRRRYAGKRADVRAYQAEYRRKNIDRLREQDRSSYRRRFDANPEPMRASRREWKERNHGKSLADMRAWYGDNKERVAVQRAARRKANPELTRQRDRRQRVGYQERQPERARELNSKRGMHRRVRMVGALIDRDITLAEVFRRSEGKCRLCGTNVNRNSKERRLRASIDHIVPISRGGKHEWSNVQLAHVGCNSAKGARIEAA